MLIRRGRRNIFYVFSKDNMSIGSLFCPEQIVILEKAAAFQKLQAAVTHTSSLAYMEIKEPTCSAGAFTFTD
jgi:hypothetical protein